MLLLSTSSLSGYGLHKIFLLAKEASYEGIDLFVDFALYDTYNSSYLLSLIEMTGMPIRSITAPEKRLTKVQLEQILKLASSLDVERVNVHPPHRLEKEKDWFGDYLKVLQKKYANVIISVINAPPKTWLFIIAEYGDARPETIKKMTEHTALSIANIDPNSGVDLMKTFFLLGSTLEFVYLSDKKEDGDLLFPGEGLMPLESLLIKLRDIGYSGMFSLHVNPESLEAGQDDKVIARLEEAKRYLRKYFG